MTFDWQKEVTPRPSGTFIKWPIQGISVTGQIAKIEVVDNPFHGQDPNKPGPKTVVHVVFTDDRILPLTQVDLENKFIAAAPQPGDLVTVTWSGVESTGKGTKKLFTVDVTPSI